MSIFSRFKQALFKTSDKISKGIDQIFIKKRLDSKTLEELEELLIGADMGSGFAAEITQSFGNLKFDKEITSAQIKEELANLIAESLNQNDQPLMLSKNQLNVILVCGVNGNGKTTTIGKLAHNYIKEGKKVAIAACDTFRAAAVEQLEHWAERSGALFIKGNENVDPASVAYKALTKAREQNYDIVFIDTAGRLQNHKNLMEELSKIIRIIKKLDETAPHHSLLVIDATTGQNAYSQVEQFKEFAGVSGLVVTKLDGTARAGVVVGLNDKFKLPIHFIGIGEGVEDLKPFNAGDFSKSIVGI